ncbi:MAG TPA: dephospho-CoA kinase [Candidatus Syntrophosphaera thermopropionivorans]|jgi:dephospho-CoA kinase|nr:dephospho-CoA kinase [Candidatus Syntrophosphaera thermopropionivorans]HRQ98807.1 dephospho-CoA kinase [Candidatus Syntrophosphaera sp.]HNZ44638.1 dephospho-CoA kinase [Candidatus Syntrophosphaera thermopropionivorans]HOJ41777.1 dephospho-CoA kinase [Candidatus Syntrophosphaera thermopropionivorans]HOL33340.1 dephospho-CoA kinase [Candidatus Syntrophosphaera thermopropionivorans]
MSQPILIGITGNIGSGKTTFCNLLEEKGFKVIYADEIAQQQLNQPDTLKTLIKRWGKGIVKNGQPQRDKIAEIVFNNKSELDFLNSIVHPKTLSALQQIVDNSTEKYLFFEIPLLFEAGLELCFDYIILIRAPREVRINRLLQKGKETREQIEARINAQIDDQDKIPLCDLVIDNSKDLIELNNQLNSLLSTLKDIKPKEKIPFSL